MHDILWYREALWSFWESHPWWCELQIVNWNRTAWVEMKELHCKWLLSAKQCQNTIQRWLQWFLLSSITPTTDAAMWINATTDFINLWLFASWISWRHTVAKWLAQGQITIEAWHGIFKKWFSPCWKISRGFHSQVHVLTCRTPWELHSIACVCHSVSCKRQQWYVKGLEPLAQLLWHEWLHKSPPFLPRFALMSNALLFSLSFSKFCPCLLQVCLYISVFQSLSPSFLYLFSRHRANEPSCVWTSANHLWELTRLLQEKVCSAIIQII